MHVIHHVFTALGLYQTYDCCFFTLSSREKMAVKKSAAILLPMVNARNKKATSKGGLTA